MSPASRGRHGPLRRRKAEGITYIELMVAMLVMAVLATLALPTGLKLRRGAQEKELKAALIRIRAAIDEYHQDWERGYIESESDHGWPETLEQLTEETEYHGPPPGGGAAAAPTGPGGSAFSPGRPPGPVGGLPGTGGPTQVEPRPKVYLRRIPTDPFNKHDREWDVSGWRARSYEDEPDSSSWGGEGVYDVYSGADWLSLDGRSRYEEW